MPIDFRIDNEGFLVLDAGDLETVGVRDSIIPEEIAQRVAHHLLLRVGEDPWHYEEGLDLESLPAALASVPKKEQQSVFRDYVTVTLSHEDGVYDQPYRFKAVDNGDRSWTIELEVLTKTDERLSLTLILMGGMRS